MPFLVTVLGKRTASHSGKRSAGEKDDKRNSFKPICKKAQLAEDKMKRLVTVFLVFSILFSTTGKSIFADQSKETTKAASVLSGKVVETMDSGRYTYVCLEKNKTRTWVAVYKMNVVVGEEMSFKPGIEMVNFESKTLNRTFDKIYFSGGPVDLEK